MSTSIIEKLTKVKAAVGAVGKGESSEQGRFSFRGVDTVVNAIASSLTEQGVILHPSSAELIASEQVTYGQRGSIGFRTTVAVEYEWTDGESSVTSQVLAEAIDSGDKSTTKAMSVAYRIAILQTLTLPTGDRDPDHDTYDVDKKSEEKEVEKTPLQRLSITLADSGFTPPQAREIIGAALGRLITKVSDLNDADCDTAEAAINSAVLDRQQLQEEQS